MAQHVEELEIKLKDDEARFNESLKSNSDINKVMEAEYNKKFHDKDEEINRLKSEMKAEKQKLEGELEALRDQHHKAEASSTEEANKLKHKIGELTQQLDNLQAAHDHLVTEKNNLTNE